MSKTAPHSPPPDQSQRERALDPTRSILVQAPAGSGKTDLLTRRFLRLLAEVDEPSQVVAITFTIAAAAEMRHRILAQLEKAAANESAVPVGNEFSMESLAHRALQHSNARDWKLLDLPAQLRISTIDGFCRELALQQPLLSGLGGGLAIANQPADLYRRAARHSLQQIGKPGDHALSAAVEALLDWHDNNWEELENLLVDMLSKRDRWMHDFLIERDPDWESLRQRLERPFASAVRDALTQVSHLLDQVPGACDEALALARFACEQPFGEQHRDLAERAAFPVIPYTSAEEVEDAFQACACLANLLLTKDGGFRKRVDKNLGFPADRKSEKGRIAKLIADLAAVPSLESALAVIPNLPPIRYTEEDWQIVRACFTLLRNAAAQLQVVFAESAAVDFVEVAQIAQATLRSADGFPSDAAIALADGIRHLLVDEFQDTSRRQHQLLAGIIAAWPDRAARTLFAVGDPMQSIYFFRDADSELFSRVKEIGLEIPNAEPLTLDFVALSANFRTTPALVNHLNEAFSHVFAQDDGSGVAFSRATPSREDSHSSDCHFDLHLSFSAQTAFKKHVGADKNAENDRSEDGQINQILELIHSHTDRIEECRLARENGGDENYRIAVLARAKRSLAPIALGLREAGIPFRAVELEELSARPEILDALALARALLNPHDRVAWLGVLRAPWCGLSLDDLHILTSADDPALLSRPIPDLLAERIPLLSTPGSTAAQRVLSTLASVPALRAGRLNASPGTLLQQVWIALGGADCCDPTARANLDLLWTCLDRLPAGEQDLLGSALTAALDKLTALPDPAASSTCGVQLMTIHKSKGLEFEVVIVPDLQARTMSGSRKLLSWLERGLAVPDDSGDITEFLIAPLQSKGDDAGKSRKWVDRVYRDRESQETRRILYVGATRAREELHLFARPTYKVETSGDLALCDPPNSLLATAWPALEPEIRASLEAWKTAAPQPDTATEIETLAASAESNLIVMPPAPKPTLLRRLPPDYRSGTPSCHPERAKGVEGSASCISGEWVGSSASPNPSHLGDEASVGKLYPRHEGGLQSRALGTAVHALFEELARRRTSADWPTARAALQRLEPHIAARMRALGVDPPQAASLAIQALQLALQASNDPIAQWILSPHPDAASEVRWTGIVSGTLINVRVDRIFRAGLTPGTEGHDAWWIVDYKTAHADTEDPAAALPELRRLFAPQLEAYATVLRNLHGADAILRAALYYPRMLQLDWWEI
jgi:ATP-dependent exoDNAse (exonuclease V) beta subunit